jgi:trehalose-6-phosphate synthase
MTPSAKICEIIYCMVCQLPPLDKWKLPNTAQIEFICVDEVYIDDAKTVPAYATYMFNVETDLHEIVINKSKNQTYDALLGSILHEIIHMKRFKTKHWAEHDRVFKSYANRICKMYGLSKIGF